MDIMISCFDRSTIMAQPWAEAGCLCYCVDLAHTEGETREGNIVKVGVDVKNWLPPRGNIVFASFFPPCTHLAVSGARWFRGKGLGALAESIELFHWAARVAEWTGAPYMIENPVSTISSYWRKPDYTFDPCDYGDPWTKRTCLWVGGGFIMPEKHPVPASEGSKIHLMPPSDDRAEKRSETPVGFARAVFNINKTVNSNFLQTGAATQM